MEKKNYLKIMIILLLFLIGLSFTSKITVAINENINCSFKKVSGPLDSALFYINNYYVNGDAFINTKISDYYTPNYNYALTCVFKKDNSPILKADFVDVKGIYNCPTGTQELIFLTNDTNSKVGIYDYYDNGKKTTYDEFNYNYFKKELCVKPYDSFSKINLVVTNQNLSNLGYICLYKTDNLTNGVISSCNAKYYTGKSYKYTVWLQVWQNLNTLKCNSNCISLTTNRVFSGCGAVIKGCDFIPEVCDGALYGSWVKFNSTYDVKCSKPWNIFRRTIYSSQAVNIKSIGTNCKNIIKKVYPVMLNNQLVNMDVFVCSDN